VRRTIKFTTKDTKSTKGARLESENKTFDAVLQFGVVEVDEQANPLSGPDSFPHDQILPIPPSNAIPIADREVRSIFT